MCAKIPVLFTAVVRDRGKVPLRTDRYSGKDHMPTVDRIVRDRALQAIERLPKLPVGATRVVAALARRDVETKELVAIVQRDPVLAARVLQTANSAGFGRVCRIESISHAVALLGPSTLRRHALSWAFTGVFKRISIPAHWSATKFTMHSEAVALLTDALCDHLPTAAGDAAYIAGLIHDFGKFVICAEAPEAIEVILSMRKETSLSITECEREVLDIDHAELSAMAAKNWRLSETICRGVHYHHQPERDSSAPQVPLSDVIGAADGFVNGLGLSFLSSPREATQTLEWPGQERAVAKALKSFEQAWRLSTGVGAQVQ